jgi:hypothetical protein
MHQKNNNNQRKGTLFFRLFRMPAAGQWVANIYVKQDVTPEGDLKELVGKCTTVYYAGTISCH